jgi:DNA-3-methyladenine glycosylase II
MISPEKRTQDFGFDPESGVVTMTLPAGFSYSEALHYLSRSPLECLHLVEDRRIYKLLELEPLEEPVFIEISEQEQGCLLLRSVEGKPLSPSAGQAAVSYIQEWFDLKRDVTPFYVMAERDPLLSKLAEDYAGLRIIGVPDLFEALSWAVVGQQVNLTFAYTMKKRLVESYGLRKEWNGRTLWRFPKPADIASLTVEELRQLQLTTKKAEFLIGIAKLMDSGDLTKEALASAATSQEAERQLTSIRGIGPWTANYVMMRCLRDTSAFPIGDAGLQNALKASLQRTEKPSADEIRAIFEPWHPWEAYAVFYLWRSLS